MAEVIIRGVNGGWRKGYIQNHIGELYLELYTVWRLLICKGTGVMEAQGIWCPPAGRLSFLVLTSYAHLKTNVSCGSDITVHCYGRPGTRHAGQVVVQPATQVRKGSRQAQRNGAPGGSLGALSPRQLCASERKLLDHAGACGRGLIVITPAAARSPPPSFILQRFQVSRTKPQNSLPHIYLNKSEVNSFRVINPFHVSKSNIQLIRFSNHIILLALADLLSHPKLPLSNRREVVSALAGGRSVSPTSRQSRPSTGARRTSTVLRGVEIEDPYLDAK